MNIGGMKMAGFVTDKLDKQQRDFLLEVISEATDGDWTCAKLSKTKYGVYKSNQPGAQFIYSVPPGWGPLDETDDANITFIVLAKNALPKLCKQIDGLETQLEKAKQIIRNLQKDKVEHNQLCKSGIAIDETEALMSLIQTA
jgi:hypothetical protein